MRERGDLGYSRDYRSAVAALRSSFDPTDPGRTAVLLYTSRQLSKESRYVLRTRESLQYVLRRLHGRLERPNLISCLLFRPAKRNHSGHKQYISDDTQRQ